MTCYNQHVDRANDGAAIIEHVPARAALADNPSDGYHGAVLAIPVDAYGATVTLKRSERWTIADQLSGRRVFDDVGALRQATKGVTSEDPHALLLATIAEFFRRDSATMPPCSIDVASTIPVSVGLAGSSAIVIATLRAMFRAAGKPLPERIALASIVLGVETQRLGITAGLQDRWVQTYAQPLLMRFDTPGKLGTDGARGDQPGSVEMVTPGAELRFLVAHRPALSEPSHLVHGELRRRFDDGDPAVRAAMSQMRAHALSARDAFIAGDAERLGQSMEATFDLRATMIDLSAGHVEMIGAARSVGASANYTGSGGAIVVLSRSDGTRAAARQSLKRLGCEFVAVDVDPETPRPAPSRTVAPSSG